MFEQIKIESSKSDDIYSKVTDIFLIIADLYRNNMLLAKFHDEYYKYIIYNAKLVYSAENNRNLIESTNVKVVYDEEIMAQHFIAELSEKDNFRCIIDSLYYLSDNFKIEVLEECKEEFLSHTINLFDWVRENVRVNDRSNNKNNHIEDCESDINYFLEKQIGIVLTCPQIYISTINYILKKQRYELIKPLLEYKSEAYDVFYSYTSPEILLSLIDLAFQSDEGFLLCMIALIKCAKNNTNDLLWYILNYYNREYEFERKRIEKRHCIQAITFWELMNHSENADVFRMQIKERKLYNEIYNEWYILLFQEYQHREKNIMRDELINEIHKFRIRDEKKEKI